MEHRSDSDLTRSWGVRRTTIERGSAAKGDNAELRPPHPDHPDTPTSDKAKGKPTK